MPEATLFGTQTVPGDTAVKVNSSGQLLTAGGGSGATADQVQGTAATDAAAVGNPVQVGGVYNATPVSLEDLDAGALQVDATGNLLVNSELPAAAALADATANPTITSVGNFSHGFNGTTWDRIRAGLVGVQTTFTGILNTIGMARYNATPPTLADGNIVPLQSDANGYLKSREQYAPGYEDNTLGKAVVEHRYSYGRVTADGQIKASAGFIHTVTLTPTTATPTAGLITIYDSLTETGTVVFSEWFFATDIGHSILLDVSCATGIYVGYDAAVTNMSVTVSYR